VEGIFTGSGKVEWLCKGVLTEVVPGLFDSKNPEHLKSRQEAMDHFGTPVSWSAPEEEY
jgi:hypothetical protein